jgi:predicted signal transduction protein with EAL and GGDEF domain
LEVAERIRARIASEPFPDRAVTVSIGVAEFPTHADRPETMIALADEALYEAKHGGRNRAVQAEKPLRPAKRTRKGEQEPVLPSAKRPARAKKKG